MALGLPIPGIKEFKGSSKKGTGPSSAHRNAGEFDGVEVALFQQVGTGDKEQKGAQHAVGDDEENGEADLLCPSGHRLKYAVRWVWGDCEPWEYEK